MSFFPTVRTLLLFTLLTSAAAFSQQKNPLSGKQYLDLHELKEMRDYESSGGCVVGPGPDHTHTMGVYTSGKNTVIVLERLYYLPGDDVRYSVADTVNLGPIDPMNHISFYDCELNGTADNAIIAVHEDQQGDYYTTIQKAWTADLTAEQLVPIPDAQLKLIRCPKPGDEMPEDVLQMEESDEIPVEVYEDNGHAGQIIYQEPLTRREKRQLRKEQRKARD